MKLIDAVVFWKRKAMIEGSNDQSKNFEMDILDEGALYKALTVTEKTSDLIKPGATALTVILYLPTSLQCSPQLFAS